MSATLPDATWRSRAGLGALALVLGADEDACRFVGGAVRDTLLGIDVHDIDIATRHAPDQVLTLLKDAGIKAVPTGMAHGTITAVLSDGPVEITTLRRDVSTDGRHATIAYTDDWREDAARRDFTINALYAEPISGRVHDYFGGMDDLAAARVRFIGDPLRRIAEDHLRILRFFRFLARFGDAPDSQSLTACAARANDLMALSRERIAAELLKLLVARDAVRVVALMLEKGIFAPVLPEIGEAGVESLAQVAAAEAACGLAPDAERRLAALLPRDPATGEVVAARLKLSNAQRKRIATALGQVDGTPDAMAYRIGPESAIDRLILSDGDGGAVQAAIQTVRNNDVPVFPLSGGKLVARGVTRGPEVARMLRAIENQWIDEGFPDSARVEEITDDALDHWLRSMKKA